MILALISCEIFYREMCAAAARSPHRVDLQFLPKGLHDLRAEQMRARLQEAIDAVPADACEAVLLGYGLCNNGLHNVRARALPLVLPRAHDCLTLFFGSRRRYREYFDAHPGVYFKTSGWIERGEADGDLKQASIGHLHGLDRTYDQLVEQYGEDNAAYLFETLVAAVDRNYRQYTYIEMGVEPDDRFEQRTRQDAAEKGWAFEKVRGEMTLIERLAAGDWPPEDFLLVAPGERIIARYDEGVVTSGPSEPEKGA